MSGVVRAAGGVITRAGAGGEPELLVVHRPKYDDWTFPKGKLEAGESDEQAAGREVEEETGLRCQLGHEVGTTSYTDNHGHQKTVRYWTMAADGGAFSPNSEVDEVRWLPLDEASTLLTYERDRRLLATAEPWLEGFPR